MTDKNERWKTIRNEVEDYEQTVKALLAFGAFVIHDGELQRPDSEFGFGRRMTTSLDNIVHPSGSVKPDLVAQKSSRYGIVAEAKTSLTRDQSRWSDHLAQLRKYDDELTGWWTQDEKIAHSDAVMLIHQSRGRQFVRFLQERKEDDPGAVGPHTSVVEFNRSDQAATYYFFRIEEGSILDTELSNKIETGIQIPLDDVLKSFPLIHYYDSPPPVVLLLMDLWTEVFPSLITEGEYNEKTGSWKIPVFISNVTEELQRAYGSGLLKQDSRSSEFPRRKWVRQAFEWLVRQKRAIPPANGNDNYTIYYKPLRGDVLDRFIKMELAYTVHPADDTAQETGQVLKVL